MRKRHPLCDLPSFPKKLKDKFGPKLEFNEDLDIPKNHPMRKNMMYKETSRLSFRSFLRRLYQFQIIVDSNVTHSFLFGGPNHELDYIDLIDISMRKNECQRKEDLNTQYEQLVKEKAIKFDQAYSKIKKDILELGIYFCLFKMDSTNLENI